MFLAANRQLPEPLFERLFNRKNVSLFGLENFHDAMPLIHVVMSLNDALPSKYLLDFLKSKDPQVRMNAIFHPSSSIKTLAENLHSADTTNASYRNNYLRLSKHLEIQKIVAAWFLHLNKNPEAQLPDPRTSTP
jgi:hypothetical protein